MSEVEQVCECGRGPVVAVAFKRNSSLLVRRIGDMGHQAAADWRCADCIGDFAEDVGRFAGWPPQHPDFAPTTPVLPGDGRLGESLRALINEAYRPGFAEALNEVARFDRSTTPPDPRREGEHEGGEA